MNKNICVLIDDDEDDQLIFETVIHMSFPDYELRLFSRFEEAKPYLTENAHRIGPIFIDLNMPKANGIDCLNFLRSVPDYQDAPIIIYSTSKNPDDAQKSLKNGATAFISKPSRIKDLITELSPWLNN
ncbi:response regulator [Brumimicrobium sp.]|uniref:response regulator n=1 Tax=Brumimicrobium sp. TaxID=2029867 RepID=UPI002639AB0F|nr:response regulator [uncultured Brumimicrobium sp.]